MYTLNRWFTLSGVYTLTAYYEFSGWSQSRLCGVCNYRSFTL